MSEIDSGADQHLERLRRLAISARSRADEDGNQDTSDRVQARVDASLLVDSLCKFVVLGEWDPDSQEEKENLFAALRPRVDSLGWRHKRCIPSQARGYKDLAAILSGSRKRKYDAERGWGGYISLRDYAAGYVRRPYFDLYHAADELEELVRAFDVRDSHAFDRALEKLIDVVLGNELHKPVADTYRLIYHGLPIFNEARELVPRDDADVSLMVMKSKFNDAYLLPGQPGMFPPWMREEYCFQTSHLASYFHRFGERTDRRKYSEAQIAPLRAAFLADIGMSHNVDHGVEAPLVAAPTDPANDSADALSLTDDRDSKVCDANSGKVAAAYEQIKTLSGYKLVRLMCEATIFDDWRALHRVDATLTDEFAKLTNPFLIVLAGTLHHWPRVHLSHRDLASVWLQHLDIFEESRRRNREGFPEVFEEPPAFMSLRDYIARCTELPKDTDAPGDQLGSMENLGAEVEYFMYRFFHANESCFDDALYYACRLVYHGVPLYPVGTTGPDMGKPIPSSHPDAAYLAKKAEYDDARAAGGEWPGCFPDWAARYCVSQEHLQLHDQYFFARRQHYTDTQVQALRAAMLSEMGVEQSSVAAAGDASDEARLRSALVALERENETLRERVIGVGAESDFHSRKLELALMVWRSAVEAKQRDDNSDSDCIGDKGVTEWMENWLMEQHKLRPTPAGDIAKVASWAGRGAPAVTRTASNRRVGK